MKDKGNSNSPITYNQLTVGYEFPPTSYELDSLLISEYLEAVGEHNFPATGFAPPLAIAAYAITAMADSFLLPGGVIHASQELEFFKLVPVGAKIECHNRVAQKLDRGKTHLLAIEFNAFDEDREQVLSGKATLVLSD